MPIVIVALLAAFALGWFERTDIEPAVEEIPVDLLEAADVPEAPDDTLVTWQEACRAAFEEQIEASSITLGSTGMLKLGDSPAGAGSIWYELSTPDGARYSAGVSDVQSGDVPDRDWYSLNGAIEPESAMSYMKDEAGRSGAVAAVGGTPMTRAAFRLHFMRAVETCLALEQ